MFAVISTGGKQYRVAEGRRIRVERLSAEVGDELQFDAMLIGGDEGAQTCIGTGAEPVGQVRATVCEHARLPKVEVIKFKRRKGYRRTLGHRQPFTTLEISRIEPAGAPAGQVQAEQAAAAAPPPKAVEAVEES